MTANLLKPLADPGSVPFAITSAALIGAGTLIDPNRLSTGRRLVLRFGTAAFTGASVLLGLRKTPTMFPGATAGTVLAVTGAVLALSEAMEALDARLQRALVRAGAEHPRWVLAGCGAALSLTVWALERISASRAGAEEELHAGPSLRPLEPEVRGLLEGMLAQTEDHGAATLRAQLETAQEQLWSGPEEDAGFVGLVEFAVDEALPRAVPHSFTFPVKARFRTPRGVPAEASLLVSGGRLASLVVDVDVAAEWHDDFGDGDPLEDLTTWPSRHEVEFVMDTAD